MPKCKDLTRITWLLIIRNPGTTIVRTAVMESFVHTSNSVEKARERIINRCAIHYPKSSTILAIRT